ncbi:MAG: FecR family protein [Mangrovibacterium sp.]
MEKSDQIPEYVFACLRKKATKQELEQLEKWLSQDDNAGLYRQLQQIDQMSADLKLYRSFDPDKARGNVLKAILQGKRLSFIDWTQRAAAILFLPLVLTSLFVLYQYKTLKNDLRTTSVIQQVDTQPGTKTHFFLPDSTEVWLNAATTIKFPSEFTGSKRTVELDGEAYFRVFKNKKKPFIVKSGSFEVKALGTAFNLCTYSEDKKFTAALEEGKIQISGKNANQSLILDPGELVHYSVEENQFTRSQVDVQDIIAWKDGRLIFNQTLFSDVVLKLGRWFNADIQLSDQTIANYRYTATFTNESLKQVLELLKLTAPIDYSFENRVVTTGNHFTKERIRIWKNPNAKIKITN